MKGSENVIQTNQNFSTARVKAGFSLRALATAAGLSYGSVFHAEHGGAVTPKNARKLCTALDMDFDELFVIVEGDNGEIGV